MTYITLKENNGAGIGHNSRYLNNLIYLVHSKSNLKYLHTPFQLKSEYYDIILQYNKIFENHKVNYENLNKINITNISDFDLNDDNTLLIVDEKMMYLYINNNLKNKNITNEVNEILIKNIINIRNFLKDDIDYDINSINITLHIRRGDIMKNNEYLNINKSRYLPYEYYTNILNKLQNLNLGKLKINIVSEGDISSFENDFKDFNINYILGTDDKDTEELKRKTISYLIFNDILVTAPSGLSNISTIYSTGLVINNNIKGILKNNCDVKKKLDLDNINREEILNKIYLCTNIIKYNSSNNVSIINNKVSDINFVPLGPNCTNTFLIKNLGLRKFALPFDWLFINRPGLLKCIDDDFKFFLKDLYFDFNSNRLKDPHYNFLYPHIVPYIHIERDYSVKDEIDDSYVYREGKELKIIENWEKLIPEVQIKFNKRIKRFINLFKDDKPIFILMDNPHNFTENIKLINFLKNKYNKDNIYIISNSNLLRKGNISNFLIKHPNIFIVNYEKTDLDFWKYIINFIINKVI